MKRHGFTLIELIVVVVIIGILAAILFPVTHRSHHNPRRSSCQSNLKQIGLGFKQYIQDYHVHYPLVKVHDVSTSTPPYTKPYGWADALHPYIKRTEVYQCPSETNLINSPQDAAQRNFVDYWYNRRVAGQSEEKMNNTAMIIIMGDGNTGQDATTARYNLEALPLEWIKDKSSPAYRHLVGANYAFADGHVKWLKPDKVSNTATDGPTPSFVVR